MKILAVIIAWIVMMPLAYVASCELVWGASRNKGQLRFAFTLLWPLVALCLFVAVIVFAINGLVVAPIWLALLRYIFQPWYKRGNMPKSVEAAVRKVGRAVL